MSFWARNSPRATAIVAGSDEWSYSDLLAAIRTVCAALGGIGQGSRIAIFSHNKRDTAIGVLASLMTGGSAVVLNPHLTSPEVGGCIDDTTPAAYLVSRGDASAFAALRTHASVRGKPTVAIPLVPSHELAEPLRTEPLAEDEWAILYSSGSTGTPKGIERDYESMQTELLGWCLELGLTSSTRFYVARPVFYTGGLVLTMATLLAGGTVVLNELADATGETLARDIRSAANRSALDWIFIVPDQARLLLQTDTSMLRGVVRSILVMGAPISGREKTMLSQALACRVIESWGNSESLGTITSEKMLREAPGSVGRPFLGDSMCVVDENGDLCPPNEIGLLAGGEAAGFTRYTKRPDETANAKKRGLIVSEDLGWVDEEGRFYVAGRVQERVVIEGKTVFLPRLEEELRARGLDVPLCATARTVNGQEEIGILLQTTQDNADKATATVADDLRALKITSIRATLQLPRTTSGKLDRKRAAEILWQP